VHPPSITGGVKITVAWALPAIAATLVGALGAEHVELHCELLVQMLLQHPASLEHASPSTGSQGVTELDALDAVEVPLELVALTVNV